LNTFSRSNVVQSRAILAAVGVLTFVASAASAQSKVNADPAGTWRGTSLCLVRPSSCNDEVVVYRVTRVAGDSMSMDARKIVAGKEEEMGVLACKHVAAQNELRCAMRNGTWSFLVRHDSLVGDLKLPDGTRFRDVRTARAAR
jgi:hypothetical protein